jgi:hypothetical protein
MRRIDDEDDDDMVRDGESVRVPVFLVDTVRFQDGEPHFVRAVDEGGKSASLADLDTARDAARAARDAWIKQTCDAWRTPSRDAAEPAAAEALLTRHLRDKPDDDGAPDPGDVAAVERRRLTERGAEAQRERDTAWQQYKDRLSNAWRGRAYPREAGAAERNETQLEAWRKPGARPGVHQDATNDSAAAYAAYVERIGRAWRAT